MSSLGPTHTLFDLLGPEINVNILEFLPYLSSPEYNGLLHLLSLEHIFKIEALLDSDTINLLWTNLLKIHFPHLSDASGSPRDLFLNEYRYYRQKIHSLALEPHKFKLLESFLLASLRGELEGIEARFSQGNDQLYLDALRQCAAMNGKKHALASVLRIGVESSDDIDLDLPILKKMQKYIRAACLGIIDTSLVPPKSQTIRGFLLMVAAVAGNSDALMQLSKNGKHIALGHAVRCSNRATVRIILSSILIDLTDEQLGDLLSIAAISGSPVIEDILTLCGPRLKENHRADAAYVLATMGYTHSLQVLLAQSPELTAESHERIALALAEYEKLMVTRDLAETLEEAAQSWLIRYPLVQLQQNIAEIDAMSLDEEPTQRPAPM